MRSHDCSLADRRGHQAIHEPTVVACDENVTRNDLEFLEEQINEYNFATTGISDARLLVALLRDPNGRIYAGLSGHTWGSVAEVRYWLGHFGVNDVMGTTLRFVQRGATELDRRAPMSPVRFYAIHSEGRRVVAS